MKKIVIISVGIILISSINPLILHSSNDSSPTMTWLEDYPLYKDRVTNFCSEYKKNDNTSETIYLLEDDNIYPDLANKISSNTTNFLEDAKKLYRKNMDGIYDCATNLVHLRALNTVKTELIKNSPKLSSRLSAKIDQRIKKIENKIQANQNKCKVNSEKNDNIIKKSVLKQSTYELCRYMFYLEYLKNYSNNLNVGINKNDLGQAYESVPIMQIINDTSKTKNAIFQEQDESLRAFSFAFKAYSEYENNLVVHIMLDLLKEDYLALREELHKNLNPINQVVYKISNAMRK